MATFAPTRPVPAGAFFLAVCGRCTAVRNPKLSAVAVASMTGNDFAMRLDRAIMRSGKLIEAKAIESPQGE
jgi:hypothetical protein